MAVSVTRETCECGTLMINGQCLNADCSAAQAAATEDATRTTAKVAVAGARATETKRPDPRSFNISGRVD